MNAYESQSESESDSHSVLVTISSKLIINENEKEKAEVSAEQKSDEAQDTLYIFEEILSPHKNNKDHLIGEKEEAQLKEGEDRIVDLERFQSLSSEKANPACENQLQNPLEHHENNTLDKAIERNPIVITEQASENKEENRPRDREERPLVLEERHSLSIAETKKRRASVYCDDNLFIPRELARSELHQRRFPTSLNNLDRISKHSDYRLRMLKFPVGSGRARFVAQQLKRRKLREQRMKTEEKRKLLEHKKSQMKEETQMMPNLNQEKLPSDEECCIILEEIVVSETEEDGTDELIERVSKRQLKRSSSLDLSRSSANELLADKQDQQQLPLFRWHNPDCSDNSRKMGILEDISLSASVDIQVGYSEMPNTSSETASQQQPQQHQEVIVEVVAAELQSQQQPLPRPCAEVVEQPQQQQQQLQLTYSQQQHQHQQQQQHQYYLRQLQPPPYQPRLQCFQDAFSQYAESQLADSNNTLMPPPPPPPVTTTTLASLRPTPMQPPPPPVAYRTEIRQQPARSGRMMRRRHTIDHRANNMMLYPPYATPAAPSREALRRTNATAATAAHFSRPDTSTTVANERNHVNQAIEQTAITSIISNYVTNYLNDMESRNP
ncbi:SUN domain-containing protein 2 [Drosophila sulfurigaster albostrigata]|uniref:SUN domain-containing protein 2 n=1 Tax=Drosophila sulfurigaster albostrigata TaxID=89887 RepID=UPI002D21DBCE|nr:SUN domain-containing protein 2 [Drosophila sulfurigaster albostrigata]